MLGILLAFLTAMAAPMDHVRSLVEISPRVAGSPGGYQAQAYVLSELQKSGWNANMRVGPTPGSGFVAACQSGVGPTFWVLAHTDVVAPECPGAIDNAGSVAVALEVAKKVRRAKLPTRLCFGFTDGEELGLHGARYLAKSFAKDHQPVFAVALEFLGQGELSAMGIGEHWGAEGLTWLRSVGGISVPYAYRVYSSLFPSQERSDHKIFADEGVRSMLLMGRGKAGVYWPYHTAQDNLEQVDSTALSEAVDVLMTMVQRGPPESSGGPALSIPYVPLVLPGMLVWVLIGLGIGVGLVVGLPAWRTAIGGLGWASVAGVVAGVVAVVPGFDRPMYGSMAELAQWLWWMVCFWVLLSTPFRKDGRQAGSLVCAWMSAGLCAIHPLLALPWALMAISCALSMRLWPMLFLVVPFPLFLTSGDLWRELVFHGVLPGDPLWWLPLKCLAMWPVACVVLSVQPARSRFFHVAAGLLLVTLCSLLFLSDPFAGSFFEREVLLPPR